MNIKLLFFFVFDIFLFFIMNYTNAETCKYLNSMRNLPFTYSLSIPKDVQLCAPNFHTPNILTPCCSNNTQLIFYQDTIHKFYGALSEQFLPIYQSLILFRNRLLDVLATKITHIKAQLLASTNLELSYLSTPNNLINDNGLNQTHLYLLLLNETIQNLDTLALQLQKLAQFNDSSITPLSTNLNLQKSLLPVLLLALHNRSNNNYNLTNIRYIGPFNECLKSFVANETFLSNSNLKTKAPLTNINSASSPTFKPLSDSLRSLNMPFEWLLFLNPLSYSPSTYDFAPNNNYNINNNNNNAGTSNSISHLLRLLQTGAQFLEPWIVSANSFDQSRPDLKGELRWPLSPNCTVLLARMYHCQACHRDLARLGQSAQTDASLDRLVPAAAAKINTSSSLNHNDKNKLPICRSTCASVYRYCLPDIDRVVGPNWATYLRQLKISLNKNKLKNHYASSPGYPADNNIINHDDNHLSASSPKRRNANSYPDLLTTTAPRNTSLMGPGSVQNNIHPLSQQLHTLLNYALENLGALNLNATKACGHLKGDNINIEPQPNGINGTDPFSTFSIVTKSDKDISSQQIDTAFDSLVREFIDDLDDDTKWKKISFASGKLGALFSDVPDQICSLDVRVGPSNRNCWDGVTYTTRLNRSLITELTGSNPNYRKPLIKEGQTPKDAFELHLARFKSQIEAIQKLLPPPASYITQRANQKALAVGQAFNPQDYNFNIQSNTDRDLPKNFENSQVLQTYKNGAEKSQLFLPQHHSNNDGMMGRLIDGASSHLNTFASRGFDEETYSAPKRNGKSRKTSKTSITDLENYETTYGSGASQNSQTDSKNHGNYINDQALPIKPSKGNGNKNARLKSAENLYLLPGASSLSDDEDLVQEGSGSNRFTENANAGSGLDPKSPFSFGGRKHTDSSSNIERTNIGKTDTSYNNNNNNMRNTNSQQDIYRNDVNQDLSSRAVSSAYQYITYNHKKCSIIIIITASLTYTYFLGM